MAQRAASVKLTDITKRFSGKRGESVTAVDKVDLTVTPGKLVTLLGPSGCGKTTLLRMIGGFEPPSGGAIYLNERDITWLPPHRRDTAMVFQNYALFPHMSVFHNVAFGLKLKHLASREIEKRVHAMLSLVGLEGLANRPPGKLSGGQQQRVALARALVMEPSVLLLDEPLSNLDAALRVQMRAEIRKLQQKLGITTIYVTHDQEEAMALSDEMVVMQAGRVEQIGDPLTVYRRPKNQFVASFVGKAHFVPATVIAADSAEVIAKVPWGEVRLPKAEAVHPGEHVQIMIRPEHVRVGLNGTGPADLKGELRQVIFAGGMVTYHVALPSGLHLTADCLNPSELLQPSQPVSLSLDTAQLHYYVVK